MRTKEEIEFAKYYFESVTVSASRESDKSGSEKAKETAKISASLADYTNWILGESSNFENLIVKVAQEAADQIKKQKNGDDNFAA